MRKMGLRIRYGYNDDRTHTELEWKGWRPDIIVEADGVTYQMIAYTPTRLLQDFEGETAECGYYQLDPYMFLVTETSCAVIEMTLEHMYKGQYFKIIGRRGFNPEFYRQLGIYESWMEDKHDPEFTWKTLLL